MFYDNYVRQCARRGISPSSAAQEMGLSKQAVSHWKARGNTPTNVTLKRIADYFEISVDELLAEPIEQDLSPRMQLINRIERMNDAELKRLEDILRLTMPDKFKD